MPDCNHKKSKPYRQIAKKPEVRVVCLGKTGAGKTTFINCLFNYVSGRTYEDERIICITQQIVLTDPVSSKQVKNNTISPLRNSSTNRMMTYKLQLVKARQLKLRNTLLILET